MSETEAFRALHTKVADTLDRRIRAHRNEAVGAAGARLNILAEGDSWFDYPIGTVDDARSDLLQFLPGLFPAAPRLLSLAHWGDAATQMLGVAQRQRMIQVLRDPAHGRFDVILFSGGGNDVTGDSLSLWLNNAHEVGHDLNQAINRSAFGAMLGVVEAAYLDLMALRNAHAPGVPIVVNAYDFAQPTNRGVCGVGPWLYPSLHARGWMHDDTSPGELAKGASIIRDLLDAFHAVLIRMTQRPGARLFIAETRGALDPATGWVNELHPTANGARILAHRFKRAIEAALAPTS